MPGASGRGFSAIVARTSTSHAPVEPRAYDRAEVTVVRSGAVILFVRLGTSPPVDPIGMEDR